MIRKDILLFICIIFSSNCILGQTIDAKPLPQKTRQVSDSIVNSKRKNTSNLKNTAKINDYLIINESDTTFVDTTLIIKKDYKFNYLRKDNFDLIQFSNIGQTYNTLSRDFSSSNIIPIFGSRGKHFNYIEIDDVNYYKVPTPFTELMYKTAFEQGQLLDAFFTINTSNRFNFSIAYKGLRSLGKYQHILSSTGNFRVTTNYTNKNQRYRLRAHMVTQDFLNEENGGLTEEGVINFENGNEEFLDRSVFDPNFENAENKLVGKRFYLNHEYELTKSDSVSKNKLVLKNTTFFEDKFYSFYQDNSDSNFFGESFNSRITDKNTLENFNSALELEYDIENFGDISLGVNYNNYNYGYDQIVQLNDLTIPNRLKGGNTSILGSLNTDLGKFSLRGDFKANVTGDFGGYYFNVSTDCFVNESISIGASLNLNSTLPNFNTLLYQSDYVDYNWNNSDVFDNVKTNQLALYFKSSKWFNVDFDVNTINNYTYFSNEELSTSNVKVNPRQNNSTINYFRVKLNKEISHGKFTLDNTILYQNTNKENLIFNIPEFVTRNTVYFSDQLFKKALFLQTGITFNYFSSYYMDAYSPLLSEFFVQREQKLGGFPRLDFFINAKVRQTRIFFKAEHINSAWTGYNYYSAPNYPYRDFNIRFGLVWNFFL